MRRTESCRTSYFRGEGGEGNLRTFLYIQRHRRVYKNASPASPLSPSQWYSSKRVVDSKRLGQGDSRRNEMDKRLETYLWQIHRALNGLFPCKNFANGQAGIR